MVTISSPRMRALSIAGNGLGAFLSGLFLPPECVHCGGARWRATPLCLACQREMRPWLEIGAAPSDGGWEATERRFLFRLSPPLSTLIHGFKYHRRLRHVRFLCAHLRYRPELRDWAAGYDVMVPVPIHATRRRERGYNQAEAIASGIAAFAGLPVLPKALRRLRSTRSQTKLGRGDRRANLDGAFACARPGEVKGKRVLIVDDVFTTGATTDQCAAALLRAGASAVGVLALARVEAVSPDGDFVREMESISAYAV